MWDPRASLEPKLVQPADCTAEPGASMDGVDVWASTLAQLMAKRKPQDTWELLPEENLASGHMESGGFQYRLRGLSRCAEGGGFLWGAGGRGAGAVEAPPLVGPESRARAGCGRHPVGREEGHASSLLLAPTGRWAWSASSLLGSGGAGGQPVLSFPVLASWAVLATPVGALRTRWGGRCWWGDAATHAWEAYLVTAASPGFHGSTDGLMGDGQVMVVTPCPAEGPETGKLSRDCDRRGHRPRWGCAWPGPGWEP